MDIVEDELLGSGAELGGGGVPDWSPGGLSLNSCGVWLRTESRGSPDCLLRHPASLLPAGQNDGHRQWKTLVFSLVGPLVCCVAETGMCQETRMAFHP